MEERKEKKRKIGERETEKRRSLYNRIKMRSDLEPKQN